MLISSVLRILGAPEIPRRASKTDGEERFQQVAAKKTDVPVAGSEEAEQQPASPAEMVRPLLPDPSVIFTDTARKDLASYLRSLQQLTAPKKTHSVDIFE